MSSGATSGRTHRVRHQNAVAECEGTAMHQLIFVNLAVEDLDRSRAFFTALGYTFHEGFCDENALCLVLGDRLFAMLLRRDVFAAFTDKAVADATTVSETLLGLNARSRAEVDRLADQALASGGREVRTTDAGFMYGRSYADPDGHIWEVMWMDPAAVSDLPDEALAS